MSSTPREIGTLIVVVLKANHLPNKRHIGKQDPYCVVTVNGEKRRTKAIKRGGQHPEWDEEIRFTLYEDVEDELARTARQNSSTPPPPPPKDGKPRKMNIKGGKTMLVACYADDAREPDLIGEGKVDLTEVLTKGETDEWFNLTYKDKFAGKVYLELTFWSNAPAPEKRSSSKPPKNKQYGGPGSFVPSGGESTIPSSLVSGAGHRIASASVYSHSRPSSDSSSSIRPSSSLAQLDLYTPAYETQRNRYSVMDRVANDFGQLGVSDSRRRDTFPPRQDPYAQSTTQFPTQDSQGYDQDTANGYAYDTPTNLPPHHHRHSLSGPRPSFLAQDPYQPQYESTFQRPSRARYSIPSTSSGFAPLNSSSSMSFAPAPSHTPLPPDPSGFPSHTPAPGLYNPSQFGPSSGFPVPSQTPIPGYPPQMPASSSFNPFPASQSYQYQPYAPPPSVPPQQPYLPAPSAPPPSTSTPPQSYNTYSSNLVNSPEGTPGLNAPGSSSFNAGSRPLPQQPQQPPYAGPPPGQSLPGFPQQDGYHSIPPPPPLPSERHSPQSYSPPQAQTLPPPPPPPPHLSSSSPRRQSSLPQPPGPPGNPQPPVNHSTLPQPPMNHSTLPQLPVTHSTLPPPPVTYSNLPQPPVTHSNLPQPPANHSNFPSPPSFQQPPSNTSSFQTLPPPPPPLPSDFFQQNHLPPPPPPPPSQSYNNSWSTYPQQAWN